MNKLIDFAKNMHNSWSIIHNESTIKKIIVQIKSNRIIINKNSNAFPTHFGIYIFFIKPSVQYLSINDLKNGWEVKGFTNYPKIVKKRFENSNTEEEWIPFYIGKSENISKRLKEHLTHSASASTFGLKLSERNDFINKNEISIGFWSLPEMEGVDKIIKQFIITDFESKIREKIKSLDR